MAIVQPSGGGGLEEPLTLTEPLTSNYVLAEVIGAAIADDGEGSGGTPGPATVTTTTGTGTQAQIDVTIGAGGDIESVEGVSVLGALTVLPDDITYEPVTGGGLVDAALRLDLSFAPSLVGSDPFTGLAFDEEGSPQLTAFGFGPLLRVSKASPYNVIIGSGAGLLNTGNTIVASGHFAAQENSGSTIVAIGDETAKLNTGNLLAAIGSNAAVQNTGDQVVAVGSEAARLNTGGTVVAIGNKAAKNNTGNNVIAIGPSAAENNVLSNFINIGDVLTATGIDDPENSVVAFPGTLTVGGVEVTEQGSGAATAVAGAATLDQGSGVITSEALVAATTYVLTLTNSKVLTTSTVIVNQTSSTGALVNLTSVAPGSGSVVVSVFMAALTGTVKIAFAVFN